MTLCTFENSQAVAARGNAPASKSAAAPCGRTLHLSFFFDGLTRELERDEAENRISNIGRLYMAHPQRERDDKFNAYRRIYLSGLGSPYNVETNIAAHGTAKTAYSSASEIPEDVIADQSLEAAKDTFKGRRFWERLSRDLKAVIANPWKISSVLAGVIVDTTVEFVPLLRDAPISASVLKSGADTRLSGALDRFQRSLQEVQKSSDIPLRWIKVSVFGFDFGASLARAFLHELVQEETPGAELQLVFAGLFDCVDRTVSDNSLLTHFPWFRNSLDDGGFLPPQVKSALHLVAAHERHRRVRLLGKAQRGWREQLMAGMSEDIGGGLASSEAKSTDLALVSLHHMYQAAFRSGVPFPPLDQLPNIDEETAKLFVFTDHREGRSARALAGHYGRRFFRDRQPRPDTFFEHTHQYIRWLAGLWRTYQHGLRQLYEAQQNLLDQIYAGGNLRGLLGLPAPNATQSQRLRQFELERQELHRVYGWLREADDEARRLRNRLRLDGLRATGGNRQLYEWKGILLAEWFSIQDRKLDDEDAKRVFHFFTHFMHDKVKHDPTQHGARFMEADAYFVIRGIDAPEASSVNGRALPHPRPGRRRAPRHSGQTGR